jgi:hypothetical protein
VCSRSVDLAARDKSPAETDFIFRRASRDREPGVQANPKALSLPLVLRPPVGFNPLLAGRLWSFRGGSSCLSSIPNRSEGRFDIVSN